MCRSLHGDRPALHRPRAGRPHCRRGRLQRQGGEVLRRLGLARRPADGRAGMGTPGTARTAPVACGDPIGTSATRNRRSRVDSTLDQRWPRVRKRRISSSAVAYRRTSRYRSDSARSTNTEWTVLHAQGWRPRSRARARAFYSRYLFSAERAVAAPLRWSRPMLRLSRHSWSS